MLDLRWTIIAGMASVIMTGASFVGGHLSGHADGVKDEKADRARVDLAAATAAAKATKAAQSEIDRLSGLSAENETQRQTAVRTIREHTREVISNPVYRNVCVLPDAIGLLDAAADVANGKRPNLTVSSGPPGGTSESATSE